MSLRERKRARTRQALIDAAVDLIERNGYERTTIADIAAAAEIGTRTFFSYFASKEELLFPEADIRIGAALDAIATRAPGEGPAEVLLRALTATGEASDDMTGRLARLRTRVMREIPAVMGRGLQIQLAGQREMARHLAEAWPDRLDPISASAMAGSFAGGVTAALLALLDDESGPTDPAEIRIALRQGTENGLRQWARAAPLVPFATSDRESAPVVTAPDGSAVRPLAELPGAGSFAHFRLAAGEVAQAVTHATVQEIWYVVQGAGEMWRRQPATGTVAGIGAAAVAGAGAGAGVITPLRPGVCLTIPLGTEFQFRAAPEAPLEIVAATMPPWPTTSETEATAVPGVWDPTV